MQMYTCQQCGARFSRQPSQVRNPNTVCCSRSCAGKRLIGEANPNYKGIGKHNLCSCGNQKDTRAQQCSKCSNKSFSVGRKNQHIDNEAITTAVRESQSYLETANKLGTKRSTIKKYIEQYHLDITHFTPGRGRRIPLSELLSLGHIKRNATVKVALLENNIISYECSICGQQPIWNSKELVLELHHKNGNSMDNRIENLTFLCPHCHSQTDTHRGKNYGRYR